MSARREANITIMAFVFWIFLLLPAMALGLLLEKIFTPVLGPIQTVLGPLLRPEVFYTVCKVLIGVNVLLLIALLAVRVRWKRAGKLARPYINSVRGVRRLWLVAVKLVLSLGPLWQIGVIAFLALLLVLQPVREPAPVMPRHPEFEGSWTVTECAAVTPFCPLTQEELDACVGTVIIYDTSCFEKNGTTYREYNGLTVGDTYYSVEAVDHTTLTAEEFEEQFELSAAGLGYESYALSYDVLTLAEGAGPVLGQEVVGWWLYWQGAFFQAEPLQEA